MSDGWPRREVLQMPGAMIAAFAAHGSRQGGYRDHDALALAALVRAGRASAAELLQEANSRAAEVNGAINAIIDAVPSGDYDPGGPLAGVPFLLKDLNTPVAGTVSRDGSRFFDPSPAAGDAPLVTRYRRAGLNIFGKTNTPEFGLNASTEPRSTGPTRNPWNTGRTAGGSSGGAAAAVAAGIVPAAHATDGGGSIRIPASCCGLFGFKPTRARVPSWPHEHPAGTGMIHAVSRSVRDSAVLLDLATGPVPGAPYAAPCHEGSFLDAVAADPQRLRVAVMMHAANGASVAPDCLAAVADAARLCEALGHHVEEAAPTYDAASFAAAFQTVNCVANAAALSVLEARLGRAAGPDDIEPVTRAIVGYGRAQSGVQFVESIATLRRTAEGLARFFEQHDVLLTPTLAQPPVPIGHLATTGDDIAAYSNAVFGFTPFTSLFNGTGQPAMSVPLFWNADGLPIGVQFAAGFGADALLFALAGQLERARPWFARRPPI